MRFAAAPVGTWSRITVTAGYKADRETAIRLLNASLTSVELGDTKRILSLGCLVPCRTQPPN